MNKTVFCALTFCALLHGVTRIMRNETAIWDHVLEKPVGTPLLIRFIDIKTHKNHEYLLAKDDVICFQAEEITEFIITAITTDQSYTLRTYDNYGYDYNIRWLEESATKKRLDLSQKTLSPAVQEYYCGDASKVRVIVNRNNNSVKVVFTSNKKVTKEITVPGSPSAGSTMCVVVPFTTLSSITFNDQKFVDPTFLKYGVYYIDYSGEVTGETKLPRFMANFVNSSCVVP